MQEATGSKGHNMFQLVLIALSTLVSEDLACIAAGVLIAQGMVGFLPGVTACFAGIFLGDWLLLLAGRFFGRTVILWPPMRRILTDEKVEQAKQWIARRGLVVVLVSRFTPGLRLPTYFAAGLLRTNLWKFTAFFMLASAIWTPLLVGGTVILGGEALRAALAKGATATSALGITVGVGLLFGQLVKAITLKKNRVAIRASVARKIRWEFWPPWATYLPLLPYLVVLAIRHRSLTLFTLANPGIESGGVKGESKSKILQHLSKVKNCAAGFSLIPHNMPLAEKIERIGEVYPVVLKPDIGERGTGVSIVRSRDEAIVYFRTSKGDVIVQEYVGGEEFGVFYYRYPGTEQGTIFSITEKRFPCLAGNGTSTLQELIEADPRASCIAQVYLKSANRPSTNIPAAGEKVQLVELGSHCRGAIFLDAGHLKTPALEEAIDRVSKAHPGFYFGRFDVRTPSAAALSQGYFKVLELNGVTAEAASVDTLTARDDVAYRVLAEQWRIAFEIGARNRDLGSSPMTISALLQSVRS